MAESDAAGESVAGALPGDTIKPHADQGSGGHDLCLNCGHALIGAYCRHCGQSGHVHRSLGAIGHEILHGVAHFEGKFWRTLPLLIWRPGELTRRYIAGERARFVSPMAIFLFSIFAMFAAFSMVGLSPPTNLHAGGPNAALGEFQAALTEQRADAVTARDRYAKGDPKRAKQEARIAEVDKTLASLPEKTEDGGGLRTKSDLSGLPMIKHGLEKWNKNPSLMLYKLQSSSYKFSWLLIPLSLPFVWLLFFWRRDHKLYDHAVFVTYSIAFMSLLFIAITVASAVGVASGLLTAAGFAIPLAHITRQLKQAYSLGWRSAVVRAMVLSVFVTIVLTMFVAVLVLLGMTG